MKKENSVNIEGFLKRIIASTLLLLVAFSQALTANIELPILNLDLDMTLNGAPLDGQYDVEVHLYQNSLSSDPIYNETLESVNFEDGFAKTHLGFNEENKLNPDHFSSGYNWFVFTIDGEKAIMPIYTTPKALYAFKSDASATANMFPSINEHLGDLLRVKEDGSGFEYVSTEEIAISSEGLSDHFIENFKVVTSNFDGHVTANSFSGDGTGLLFGNFTGSTVISAISTANLFIALPSENTEGLIPIYTGEHFDYVPSSDFALATDLDNYLLRSDERLSQWDAAYATTNLLSPQAPLENGMMLIYNSERAKFDFIPSANLGFVDTDTTLNATEVEDMVQGFFDSNFTAHSELTIIDDNAGIKLRNPDYESSSQHAYMRYTDDYDFELGLNSYSGNIGQIKMNNYPGHGIELYYGEDNDLSLIARFNESTTEINNTLELRHRSKTSESNKANIHYDFNRDLHIFNSVNGESTSSYDSEILLSRQESNGITFRVGPASPNLTTVANFRETQVTIQVPMTVEDQELSGTVISNWNAALSTANLFTSNSSPSNGNVFVYNSSSDRYESVPTSALGFQDTQDLSLSDDSLSLTNGGSVDLSAYLDNTDEQTLSLLTNTLAISNGNSVSLASYLDNTDEQALSLSDDTLSLSNGGSVDLSAYLDDTDTDEQTLSLITNTLAISNGNSVDLAAYLDNTDEQALSLTDDTLSLTDGGSVDLSDYLDNTDTQDLSLSDDTLSLTNGGAVDLSDYLDNTDSQALSLSDDTLSLSNGGYVDLSVYLDDTDTDEQTLSLITNTLAISNGNSVDLASYLDNTDEQALSLSDDTLSLSNGGSVDLSPYLDDSDTTLNITQVESIVQDYFDNSLSTNVLMLDRDINTLTQDFVLSGSNGPYNMYFVKNGRTLSLAYPATTSADLAYSGDYDHYIRFLDYAGGGIELNPKSTSVAQFNYNTTYGHGVIKLKGKTTVYDTLTAEADAIIEGDLTVETNVQIDNDLNVTGNINYSGNLNSISDRRFKENIQDFSAENGNSPLAKLLQIKPKTYTYNEDWTTNADDVHYGVIAQDLIEVFPDLVGQRIDGYYVVNYVELIPILTAGIKEMNSEVESLRQENDDLRQTLEAIQADIQALKSQ